MGCGLLSGNPISEPLIALAQVVGVSHLSASCQPLEKKTGGLV